MKNIITFSVATIAALMLTGCGNSSSPIADNNEAQSDLSSLPTVSKEVRALASSPAVETDLMASIPEPNENQEPNTTDTIDCTSSGVVNYTSEVNQTALMLDPSDFSINLTAEAVNCTSGDTTITGETQTKMEFSGGLEYPKNTFIFVTDYVVTQGTSISTVKAGSNFVSEPESETVSVDTVNIEIETDDYTYKATNLKSRETEMSNGSTSSYEISGSFSIDDETFSVDESYDASATPEITDIYGNILKGAKKRYLDDQNHTVTIEAVEQNKLHITVDTDGDGEADEAEVIAL